MNPPAVFPTDPHLLAQWRFDERRRRSDAGGVAPHRVAMVLGRFADRVEIRNPAEAPEVAESARAIARETDKPAYRAALVEVADRISARCGEPPPADATRPATEDWLATLDAHLAGTPHAGNGGAEHASPLRLDPAPAGEDGLPDFLSGAGWDAPEPAASSGDGGPGDEPVADLPLLSAEPGPGDPVDETVDEALYIPPALGEADAAPDEPLAFLAAEEGEGGEARNDAPFEPWAASAPEAPTGQPDDLAALYEVMATPPATVPVFAVVTAPSDEPPAAPANEPPAPVAELAVELVELGRTLGLTVSGRAVADGPRTADAYAALASLDVVWRDGVNVAAAFRIATEATFPAALLDLADVLAETVDAPPPLLLVGPAALRDAARAAARRPAFARLPIPLAAGCGFLAVESLRSALERASDFLPYLRPGFVRALAERLDG